MAATRVKISDLITATRKYAADRAKKADADGDGYLKPTEAKKLVADLQDDFDISAARHKTSSKISVKTFANEVTSSMEAWAAWADRDRDGFLSATEVNKLPKELQDNVKNYRAATEKKVDTVGGVKVRDTSSKKLVAAQEKAYPSKVGYAEALAKAAKAALEDENGPRGIIAEFGGPEGEPITDPKKLDAAMKRLLSEGSLELVDTADEPPTGEQVKDAWIFQIKVDDGSDHGYWAIVDRKTGEAYATNFN